MAQKCNKRTTLCTERRREPFSISIGPRSECNLMCVFFATSRAVFVFLQINELDSVHGAKCRGTDLQCRVVRADSGKLFSQRALDNNIDTLTSSLLWKENINASLTITLTSKLAIDLKSTVSKLHTARQWDEQAHVAPFLELLLRRSFPDCFNSERDREHIEYLQGEPRTNR